MTDLYHIPLPCGATLGGAHLPTRRVVTLSFRFLAGVAAEPADELGVAALVEETIDKGTQQYTAEQLADAFDAIGARRDSATGRQSSSFSCLGLAGFFERIVELHAEMFCRPVFPAEQVEVARRLAIQELDALEDDPLELLQKYARPRTLGPVLGRHPLGERETLGRLGRGEVERYWRERFVGSRLQVALAGPIAPARAAAVLERHLAPLARAAAAGPEAPPAFTPGRVHHPKELEQLYMVLAAPGARRQAEDWPVEAVVLNLLSGGMSSRLFAEVREKQALVYWVSAWPDYTRDAGVVNLAASTTPPRGRQTFDTLLREVRRLGEDLGAEELRRAKVMIAARRQTRGELTPVRAAEVAEDLFYFGVPRDRREETARVEAVTLEDVRRYLEAHPFDPDAMAATTLGPAAAAIG